MDLITIETTINASLQKVWDCWTEPAHIVNWNFASADWCCPSAVNDLRVDGEFVWRIEAKDGSMGFDFKGIYTEVKERELIAYKMSHNRKVNIHFSIIDGAVKLTESFEAEGSNSDEQQRTGWQAILENFKKYVEANR